MTNRFLTIKNLPSDPLTQFTRWYEDARQISPLDPEAAAPMALATSSNKGRADVRFVLFKGIDSNGFVFFTDYTSSKGRDLAANPRAAIAFYWHGLCRQVRIRGVIDKLETEKSNAYFAARPRASQAATLVSRQSLPLSENFDLNLECNNLLKSCKGKTISRPKTWGGFVLVPHEIEFWQAGKNRLNNRYLYTRKRSGPWEICRLSP